MKYKETIQKAIDSLKKALDIHDNIQQKANEDINSLLPLPFLKSL